MIKTLEKERVWSSIGNAKAQADTSIIVINRSTWTGLADGGMAEARIWRQDKANHQEIITQSDR